MRRYRALVSVPFVADDDESACRIANQRVGAIFDPSSQAPIATLELLGEMAAGSLADIGRVVWVSRGFVEQMPEDWRP